jgi:sec-independent protein translocase protein TatC
VAAETTSHEVTTKKMPIMEHLIEVRNRLFKSVAAVIVTTILAFIFYDQVMDFLLAPAPADMKMQTITIMEPLSIFFKVSLTAGIIVAMPFLVYQLFAFVSPALTSKEKRRIYAIMPAVAAMFFAGVAFAYFVALPRAMGFFATFGSSWVNIEPAISSYINIVTRLLVGVGLMFETPIIIMVLARMGVVSPQWLAARRKLWIVAAFVIAALITPTFDPINQTIIALPLIILLELSIWLAKLVYKSKKSESLSAED